MKLTVLEKKKNSLFFEIEADHTFCNALKKELWNDKSVTVSGYTNEQVDVGNPSFLVESSEDPQKAVLDAIKRLKKKNTDFLKAFKAAK
jgi:DNA-directed RNA polymerase subunit L